MLRVPMQHWWTTGFLVLTVAILVGVAGGLIRLYWWFAVAILWFGAGYLFDRTVLYRWAGCLNELVTHNVNQAGAWFRKDLQSGGEQGEIQARVGHFALREKDYAEALHHLESSLERLPRAVQPRLDLALAHSKLGHHQEAEDYALHALELAPRSEATQLILAQVRKAAGDIGGAQAACEQALQQRDTSGPAHRLLGEILYRQGNTSEAQRHLQRSVTLDPKHPDGHYWLGTVHLEQKEWLRAQQHLTEALNRLVEPTYTSDVERSMVLQKLAQARLMPKA